VTGITKRLELLIGESRQKDSVVPQTRRRGRPGDVNPPEDAIGWTDFHKAASRPRATPEQLGPRNCGQFSGVVAARRTETQNERESDTGQASGDKFVLHFQASLRMAGRWAMVKLVPGLILLVLVLVLDCYFSACLKGQLGLVLVPAGMNAVESFGRSPSRPCLRQATSKSDSI